MITLILPLKVVAPLLVIAAVVFGSVPVILKRPLIAEQNKLTESIGTDICLRAEDSTELIVILCGHNINDPISPKPTAEWTLPNNRVRITMTDSPKRFGTDTQLDINNDEAGMLSDVLGEYSCTLSNTQGSDSDSTIIDVIPRIVESNVFFMHSVPEVIIGTSTCEFNGNGDRTKINCTEEEGDIPTTWTLNGTKLLNTDEESLENQGPGNYTCRKENQCDSASATSTIIGAPTIPAPGPTPIDGPGVVFEVGQSVCINPFIGEKAEIQCPLTGFSDPRFTIIKWTRAGNSNFSFEGSTISLDRSDYSLADKYTCTVTTGSNGEQCGQATAESIVNFQTKLAISSGFMSGSPDSFGNEIVIGASTCLPPEGQPLRILCDTMPITRNVSWTLDGTPLPDGEHGCIDVTGPGIYTCSGPDGCGNTVTASTEIIGVPTIPAPGPTPPDGPGVIFEVGQSVCIDPFISGSVRIHCPVLGFSDPASISVVWTRAGDPTFSFNGSTITLDRSDYSLADKYTCTVTTGNEQCGQATSDSTVNFQTKLAISSGFMSGSPDSFGNEIVIGASTCLPPEGQSLRILCDTTPITRNVSWTLDGTPLPDGEHGCIDVTGPGTYTCSGPDGCNNTVTASSEIIGIPTIPAPGPTPPDGPGVVFEVGQSVCIDPFISGSVQIHCPVLGFNDPSFTSVVWTRAGDPTFSFNGSTISLDRSDYSLADKYTCTVTTGSNGEQCGQATAESIVNFQTKLAISLGFMSGSPDSFGNEIVIGASTCLPPEGQPLRILCNTTPITRNVSWTLDGTPLPDGEHGCIDVTGPGTYTCSGPDGCNNTVTGSSEIIGIPIIPAPGPTPPDGPGVIFEVGQSVCIDPFISGSVQIHCPVLGFNDPAFTSIVWTRAGDPTFSFNGSTITLDRSDYSLADKYTCTVTTGSNGEQCGQATAESIVNFQTKLAISSGFMSGSPDSFGNEIVIGASTCLPPEGQSLRILCDTTPITRNVSWTLDGTPLPDGEHGCIDVTGPGTYTCSGPDGCNNTVTGSSEIIGIPIIPAPGPTPPDGPGVIFEVGQSVCIDPFISGSIQIHCPVLGFNDPAFTSVVWTRAGDPTFSFNGSTITLDRSDYSLADKYTCTVTTGSNGEQCGQATAESIVNFETKLAISSGFMSGSPDSFGNEIVIGASTCEPPEGQSLRILCGTTPISRNVSWTLDGTPLPDGEHGCIDVTGPGTYTCSGPDGCGNTVTASTEIIGVPTIPAPGPTPSDGPGVVFQVGQFVCIDPFISGSVQIHCPVSGFNDPAFTSVVWTRAGDPTFSFNGSTILLDRSDYSLADKYTCTVTTGSNGEQCGQATAESIVNFQTKLTISSGFMSGSPDSFGNEIVIGASTCEPPEGQSLRILCDTTPITRNVSWTLDGTSLPDGEHGCIDVTGPGTYTCSGPDGCNNTVTASSEIIAKSTVTISASINGLSDNGCSRFDDVPPMADVCPLEGETLVIECAASSGSYTISVRGNTQSTDAPLTLSPFTDSQEGMYVCTGAGNPCGTPTDSLIVYTGDLPPILPTPGPDPYIPLVFKNVSVGEDVCLATGDSININCMATSGTLPIDYAWRRGMEQTVISTDNTITVSELGEYTCTANNSIGSDSASSRVLEDIDLVFGLDPSSTQQSRCNQLKRIPKNTDLCFFTGDAANFSCVSRVSMTPGVIQPAARVTNLQERDTMFTCTLSNDCSNASSSLIILVQEPARINRMSPLPPSSDMEMNFGAGRLKDPVDIPERMTVRLHCPYSGINHPSTRWVKVKDGVMTDVVAMPPDIVLIDEDDTLVLVISKFSKKLEGTFRCVTDNNAGDDDGDVVLRFDEPPEPGEWTTTPWSSCDPDCHRGTRMRQVTCVGVSTRTPLSDDRCTEVKPDTTETCSDRGPCFLDPIWVPQEWSRCSRPCGGGYCIRNIICQIPRTGEIVDDSRCDDQLRPMSFELCNTHPCCAGDSYPAFCQLIKGTSLCQQSTFQESCCSSCSG